VIGTDIKKSMMSLIPKNKKTVVKYTLLTDNFKISNINKGIYQDVVSKHINNIGCPVTNALKDKLFYINSPYSFDVEFDKDNYNYSLDIKIHKGNIDMHNAIKQSLNLDTNKHELTALQFLTPYVFITDDKELEFTILEPNININNVEFTSGSFIPYGWLRTINSSYILIDKNKKGKISFKQHKPMMNILFNKPVDLKYIEPTSDIYNYWYQCKDITLYTSNITKHIKYIINRRPNKLL
tara:strand:+ start:3133 stop:3849 length:717 start_codon:yes stop_codon:yes gene_type:complete